MLASLLSREPVLKWGDLVLCVIGGLIAVAAVGGWAVTRRRDPLRGSPIRPNSLTPLILWVCICGHFVALWAGGVIASLLGFGMPKSGEIDPRTALIAMPVAQVLVTAMCLIVAQMTFVNGWRGFGIGRRPISRDVVWGIGAWLVSLVVCFGVYWSTVKLITWTHPQFEEKQHQILKALRDPSTSSALRFLAAGGALVLAPIAEELFFRGILQSGVKKLLLIGWGSLGAVGLLRLCPCGLVKKLLLVRWGSLWHRWIAIGLTAVLFGAMHYSTPQQVPALITLGILLGYLYERTGSLTLPVLVHMLFNGKSLLWNALRYGP